MTKRSILLLVFCAFTLGMYAQEQKPLKKDIREKLDDAWFGNGTFSVIRNNRDTCEAWVLRLKSKNIGSEELRKSYQKTRSAYDAVLDAMIADVKKANSVGDIYVFFVESKDRKTEYKKLSDQAEKHYVEFVNAAFIACTENEFGSSGRLAQFIFSTWIDVLVPDLVQKIAEVFRDAIKEYYIRRINDLRFREWDKVTETAP